MHKNKAGTAKQTLDTTPKGYLIPMVMFGITLVTIGILTVNYIDRDTNTSNIFDPWIDAFMAAQTQKIGVEFTAIATTNEEYTAMRIKANDFIEVDKSNEISLDTKTKITEEQFVDTQSISEHPAEMVERGIAEQPVETGPLYFEDMILIRYITNTDKLNVVIAGFTGKDKEALEIISSTELTNYNNELLPSSTSGKVIAEDNYLIEISDILKGIFTGDISGSDSTATRLKKLTNKYLSQEGKRTILEGKSNAQISPDTEAKILFIEACKSSETQPTKDRIYAQVEVSDTADNKVIINVILKMNSSGRIFDVDII